MILLVTGGYTRLILSYLECWYDSALEINDTLYGLSLPVKCFYQMKLCYSLIVCKYQKHEMLRKIGPFVCVLILRLC
jgi:hypothetical protein